LTGRAAWKKRAEQICFDASLGHSSRIVLTAASGIVFWRIARGIGMILLINVLRGIGWSGWRDKRATPEEVKPTTF
jgi:hypothetical protein